MSSFRQLALAGITLMAVGCEPVMTGPDPLETLQLTEDIDAARFEEMLGSGGIRVEIEVSSRSLVATEVELRPPAERAEDEEIESPITALEAGDGTGTLTLALGDLALGFGSSTKFRHADGELSFDEFVTMVRHLLDEGQHPGVRAERSPPAEPQAPDDAAFAAAELRLLPESDEREIEINIDRDNLERNSDPPPDGWINVLGLRIELRISEGITELELARDEFRTAKFEGKVASVDLDARSFTLVGGTIVRLLDRTHIAFESGDEHRLPSLEAVAEALAAGKTVFSAGEGVIEGVEPRRIAALRVVWELARPPLREFHGVVQSVDLAARSFQLKDGPTVRLTDETHIVMDADHGVLLPSLQAVAEALSAGRMVFAVGVGTPESAESRILVALKVAFKLAPPPLKEFRGAVASVDREARTVTLADETIIRIGERTHWERKADDPRSIPTLLGVAELLRAGVPVNVRGAGVVEAEDPLIIAAVVVTFFVEGEHVSGFGGEVRSVNLEHRTVSLEDGTTIRFLSITRLLTKEGDRLALGSLEAVAEALAAGKMVKVSGAGVVIGEEPKIVVALAALFELR